MTRTNPKGNSLAKSPAAGITVRLPPKLGWILLAFPAFWATFVLLQGVAAHAGYQWVGVDFTLSGAFGDSFGGLSALMASAAAVGAWAAVAEQRLATSAAEASAI